MEYSEDDYLMISGIQHFKFCRRQWALIHIEQQWNENEHTVIGELMHKRAHDRYITEKRKDLLTVRALPVSSRRLGISGECDIVEFHKVENFRRIMAKSVENLSEYLYSILFTFRYVQSREFPTYFALQRPHCV